jgi:hypothetical protein
MSAFPKSWREWFPQNRVPDTENWNWIAPYSLTKVWWIAQLKGQNSHAPGPQRNWSKLIIGFADASAHRMGCCRVTRIPSATDTLGLASQSGNTWEINMTRLRRASRRISLHSPKKWKRRNEAKPLATLNRYLHSDEWNRDAPAVHLKGRPAKLRAAFVRHSLCLVTCPSIDRGEHRIGIGGQQWLAWLVPFLVDAPGTRPQAVELFDTESFGHSRRVAKPAMTLAQKVCPPVSEKCLT